MEIDQNDDGSELDQSVSEIDEEEVKEKGE